MFSTLDAATGVVTADARPPRTRADFLAFLRGLDRAHPAHELHVMLEGVDIHRTSAVCALRERHPRFSLYVTPTSQCWRNQVGTWTTILTLPPILRGGFDSVKSSSPGSMRSIGCHWNHAWSPFAPAKTADDIREPSATSDSAH